MDSLEEHIRKYREELDLHKPPQVIWKRIRKGLGNDRVAVIRWISAAAMIVVIIGTAFLFRHQILSPFPRHNGKTQMKSRTQLRETEIYYNNLANSLYREATPLLAKYPDMEKELFSDISQLDSICADIKNDLKDNVSNQDVIEALIRNYRIKIRLLEDILTTLKENEENPVKSDSYEL